MPVVNPGIRRYIGSAIQRLFNSASFSAPLTHSLTLERGTGSPTFTRATTATFQDHEGVLRTAIAGEARFTGARRVRNLLTVSSENYSASWNPGADGTGTAPTITGSYTDGPLTGSTASRIQFNVGAGTTDGDTSFIYQLPTATKLLNSVYIKSNTGVDQKITFRARVSSTTDDSNVTALASGWTRVSAIQTGGTAIFALILLGTWKTANTADILVSCALAEDITGRTDQTTPSEYVSVGVLSAPYHGAGVDGVEYFNTDLTGDAIPAATNLGYLAEAAATNGAFKSNEFTTAPWATIGTPSLTKNATGVDGATSAWTVTVSQGDEYNQLNGITLTAATYTRSIKIKKTTGPQSAYPIVLVNAPATYLAAATIDTTNGTGTIWTAYSGWTIATSSVRVTSWNDDFWLVELTFLGTATGWAVGYIGVMTTNATKSSGSLADADVTGAAGTHVMQHLQVELGSAATSYVDNTNAAAAVTRNADVLTYTGGDIANIKTLACTFQREAGVSSAGIMAALSDGTLNNYEDSWFETGTTVRFSGVAGAAVQWASAASPYTAGDESKAAWSAATNDIKMDVDGAAVASDTSATVPTVSQLNVGHAAGSFQLNGHVGHIYGWTTNKSQSELGAIDR